MNMSQEKTKSLLSIERKLKDFSKKFTTIQETVHSILIDSVIHTYKYKGDEAVLMVLDSITHLKGFARVEAVAYWYKHISGLEPSYDEKSETWSVKFSKLSESKAFKEVRFTFNADHLNTFCKADKYRFYKIAPVEVKELKLPDDLSKIVLGAEIQMARALVAGTVTLEEVQQACLDMFEKVKSLENDKKVKDWVSNYLAQEAAKNAPSSTKEEEPSTVSATDFRDSLNQSDEVTPEFVKELLSEGMDGFYFTTTDNQSLAAALMN
jgi:hypothetical protein